MSSCIAILADSLWPATQRLPSNELLRWLDRQFQHGVKLGLVRVSELENDEELLQDMGIYGSHVVGYHTFDHRNGTKCFTLKFSFDEVALAENRWQRLSMHAISYQELLDEVS
ncbi:MAG: hypothetical protein R3C56_42385 [Pirellulaceae bacterium]